MKLNLVLYICIFSILQITYVSIVNAKINKTVNNLDNKSLISTATFGYQSDLNQSFAGKHASTYYLLIGVSNPISDNKKINLQINIKKNNLTKEVSLNSIHLATDFFYRNYINHQTKLILTIPMNNVFNNRDETLYANLSLRHRYSINNFFISANLLYHFYKYKINQNNQINTPLTVSIWSGATFNLSKVNIGIQFGISNYLNYQNNIKTNFMNHQYLAYNIDSVTNITLGHQLTNQSTDTYTVFNQYKSIFYINLSREF